MFEPTTEQLTPFLAPNERVLWQGQGKRRMNSMGAGGGIVLAVFVVMAGFFVAIFAATSQSSRGRGDTAPLIILPIIFVILGLSIGLPLLVMGQRTSNARYFVTTAAAIVLYPPTAWSGKRVTVVPLKNLQQVTLSENRDGTGTLTFGQSLMAGYGRYSNSGWADLTPAFSNIERPIEVYQLIRQQMPADR